MFFNNLPGDLLTDKILSENSTNTKTCLVYQPFLGEVEDMEGLDIKSEKFEITDNEALILNGNVVIDFPDGILEAGKARVDRKNGTVEFKKEGDLFLKDYFFRAKEGFFNEKDRSLELYSGEAYLNDRNLILAFDELKGNLEDKIILKQVSMTSCADPKGDGNL